MKDKVVNIAAGEPGEAITQALKDNPGHYVNGPPIKIGEFGSKPVWRIQLRRRAGLHRSGGIGAP